MASEVRSKKKRADEEEELELPVPDFDEAEWKRKEISSAQQALVSVTYGFVLGAGARFAQVALDDYRVGWLVLLIGVSGLRLVFKATRIDIKEWGFKEWLGTYFMLFFSFLAVWYLLINPPFIPQ